MSDLRVSTDELETAASHMRMAADYATPHDSELAVNAAVLGSDDVHAVVNGVTIQQSARAAKLAERLTSLADVITAAAESMQAQDQGLAESLEG